MLRTHSFFLSSLLLASILFDFYTALNYVYDSFARLVRRTLCSVIAASISFNLTTFLLSSQPSSLKRWNTSHSLIEFLTTTRKNETTCIPNRDLRNASISLLMCSCKMITVESSNLVAIAKCNRFKSYYINNICHLRSFSLHSLWIQRIRIDVNDLSHCAHFVRRSSTAMQLIAYSSISGDFLFYLLSAMLSFIPQLLCLVCAGMVEMGRCESINWISEREEKMRSSI